jgi:tetratricopeptide (TPR) repeat protein
MRSPRPLMVAAAVGALCTAWAGAADAPGDGKLPITTKSEEARRLYLQGRDLLEKLRVTDAREYFQQAVAKDPDFALAHLGLANTAPTNTEFFQARKRAVELASAASEAEGHIIKSFDAGVRSDPAGQKAQLEALVGAYPRDERAQNFLGGYYFGRQDYEAAIRAYQKAVAINPGFSQPYNQLGYAYRFLGHYAEAERAFKKYIELIPGDPNPYDSYAELLMKMGRFDESIKNYEKALGIDPHFVASYIGIGLDQIYLGQPEKARATFAKLEQSARNDGEKRQALARIAQSYVYEGATDKAIETIGHMTAVAEKTVDKGAIANDMNFIGNILLEAGRPDEARAKFQEGVELSDQADTPPEVKAQVRRNFLFDEARIALNKGDLAAAKAKSKQLADAVGVAKVPFEVWQTHEVAGLVALAEKDSNTAVAELKQANQPDPRVLFHLARAYKAQGALKAAHETCKQAAEHNGLNFNYAYVREKARKMLAEG